MKPNDLQLNVNCLKNLKKPFTSPLTGHMHMPRFEVKGQGIMDGIMEYVKVDAPDVMCSEADLFSWETIKASTNSKNMYGQTRCFNLI